MNIKSINALIPSIESVKETDPIRHVRSNKESSADRDPNGQQQDKPPEKRQLTDAEFLEALDKLKDLPGIKSHNLIVRHELRGHSRFVFIESPDGKLVRRLSELDLWALLEGQEQTTGHLYHKAM